MLGIKWHRLKTDMFVFSLSGAWWLGFVVQGIGLILISIPLFFFPRVMTPKDEVESKETTGKQQEEKVEPEENVLDVKFTDIIKTTGETDGFMQAIRGMLLSFVIKTSRYLGC